MSTSTRELCEWGFRYSQDTGNKYYEAKGAVWKKCFLPSVQYFLPAVLCPKIIYHS